jgi:hypothetical protein
VVAPKQSSDYIANYCLAPIASFFGGVIYTPMAGPLGVLEYAKDIGVFRHSPKCSGHKVLNKRLSD